MMKEIVMTYMRVRVPNRRFASQPHLRNIPAYETRPDKDKLIRQLREFYDENSGIHRILTDRNDDNSCVEIPEAVKEVTDDYQFVNEIARLILNHATRSEIESVFVE